MLVADILHSCADEAVAAAAVASVGGAFAAAVRAEAGRCGLSAGKLTASLVAGFARDASERDWRGLAAAMTGTDQPVLAGLQFMAERGLRLRATAIRAPHDASPPAPLPDRFARPAADRCPAA